MIVVGGTYDEVCFEPKWDYKFGSGLRAVFAIRGIDPNHNISFHSFGDENTDMYVQSIANNVITPHIYRTPYNVRFEYDFPLSIPHIYPRIDLLTEKQQQVQVQSDVTDNVLYYGMLEGTMAIAGNKVVYDPQSPANPKPFSSTGSTAEELAIVTNFSEAKLLSGENDLSAIVRYFFTVENSSILVLKMGAKGALIFTGETDQFMIPVYKTEKVWPIGSGDVFAASFAYYWFNGKDPVESAKLASWNTACYCNSRTYEFKPFENGEFVPLLLEDFPSGQIYLAGPFFTFTQRWLIHQVYTALRGMQLKVFSPWHDVGHGEASYVVPLDLKGLIESELVFAIIDGLDSGTLFEIGYGIAKDINVVGYVENESSENIKMLVGTECLLENDLTTAIYKSLWKLAE